MRVAALYDIHGNLPALEAVLEEVGRAGVDRIVVGGDVLPGPMPRETIDCLARLDAPVQFIHGNGDRETLAAKAGVFGPALPEGLRGMMRWVAEQLRPEDERRVADWPATVRLTLPDLGEVLFCHATPRNDTEIFTRVTAEDRLAPIFEHTGAAVVVCGHTHMPFDRLVGRTRIVNAGSVGMPFGRPGADWLLLGPGIEPRHVDYDLRAAAERIRATAYPQAEDFIANYLLHPPPEERMLEVFGRAELR